MDLTKEQFLDIIDLNADILDDSLTQFLTIVLKQTWYQNRVEDKLLIANLLYQVLTDVYGDAQTAVNQVVEIEGYHKWGDFDRALKDEVLVSARPIVAFYRFLVRHSKELNIKFDAVANVDFCVSDATDWFTLPEGRALVGLDEYYVKDRKLTGPQLDMYVGISDRSGTRTHGGLDFAFKGQQNEDGTWTLDGKSPGEWPASIYFDHPNILYVPVKKITNINKSYITTLLPKDILQKYNCAIAD